MIESSNPHLRPDDHLPPIWPMTPTRIFVWRVRLFLLAAALSLLGHSANERQPALEDTIVRIQTRPDAAAVVAVSNSPAAPKGAKESVSTPSVDRRLTQPAGRTVHPAPVVKKLRMRGFHSLKAKTRLRHRPFTARAGLKAPRWTVKNQPMNVAARKLKSTRRHA